MLKVYAIFDDKAGCYNLPFYCNTDGMAVRAFSAAINDSQRLESQYPQDFHLYRLGEFDDEKGCIINETMPVFVANGVSLTIPPVSLRSHGETAVSGSARGKDDVDA